MASDTRQFAPATFAERLFFGSVASVLVAVAQVGTLFLSTRQVVEYSRKISVWLVGNGHGDAGGNSMPSWDVPRTLHLIQVSLRRASDLVPGARCLHRSVAARVWLAAIGIRSSVVVGVARGLHPCSPTSEGGQYVSEQESFAERHSARQAHGSVQDDAGFHGHAWLEFEQNSSAIDSDLPETMFDHPNTDYTEVYRR